MSIGLLFNKPGEQWMVSQNKLSFSVYSFKPRPDLQVYTAWKSESNMLSGFSVYKHGCGFVYCWPDPIDGWLVFFALVEDAVRELEERGI